MYQIYEYLLNSNSFQLHTVTLYQHIIFCFSSEILEQSLEHENMTRSLTIYFNIYNVKYPVHEFYIYLTESIQLHNFAYMHTLQLLQTNYQLSLKIFIDFYLLFINNLIMIPYNIINSMHILTFLIIFLITSPFKIQQVR